MLRRCLTILHSLAALGIAACIPVRWSEPGSPQISGRIRGPDGKPAAGLRVAVSGSMDDACRHPAAVTVTDQWGRFSLPNTELEHRFFILLPIEKFTQVYRVCGGGDTTALVPAYDGHMPAHVLGAPDSVTCFSWWWRSALSVTCSSLAQKKDLYGREVELVVSGGDWADGAEHGSYRIVSTRTSRWVLHSQLFVQWLRDSAVVSTMELTELTSMDALVDPKLSLEQGGWSVVLTGFQGSDVRRTLIFKLGPPNHVRLLAP